MENSPTPVFASAPSYTPESTLVRSGQTLPVRFGDASDEYHAAQEAAGVFDFSDRGLVNVTGSDRKEWLHNLVTNAIKTLDDGHGNYAFSLDTKGRIQFDLNVLTLTEHLWLDIDRARVPAALQHLDMRLITEDVQLSDISADWARLGVCGANAEAIAKQLGVGQFAALPELGHAALSDGGLFVRHDFTGTAGFELIVPASSGAAWWQRMVEAGATPWGMWVRDVLEIEAGRPRWGRDMDDQILPPETGQVERGISYNKGCYLGQEVIERMRSRGVLAKRLMQVSATAEIRDALPVDLVDESGAGLGRLLSLVKHPRAGTYIGLAHVRAMVPSGTSIKTTADETITLVAPIGDLKD